MARNIEFSLGEFYHIYNRGTEKRNIFKSGADYKRFLALLYACNSNVPVVLKLQGRTLEKVAALDRGKTLIDIANYCLMPNHFHLLVQEKTECGISRFMQKLLTAYSMYFNKRYERTGTLFQSKFKASHANNDQYLKYLISYIHLNPIKLIEPKWKEAGIADRKRAEQFLNSYQYSSFPDYTGQDRQEKKIVSLNILPEYFESAGDFKKSVTEWLSYNKL